MTGAGLSGINVKTVVLVAVPPGVVTAIAPLVAPVGTTKVMVVPFTTVKPVMATPFSVTAVAPVKSVPVMVTVAPAAPEVGVKLVMVGATVTVKVPVLVAVPPGVVTARGPLVAPAGTVKVMVVAFTTVKPVVATPFSVRAVAPVRLVPVTVTVAPALPEVGVKLVMVGTAAAGATGAKATPRKNELVPGTASEAGNAVVLGAAL